MRKHVKPADPTATIPDPARRGDLPAEGREVDWGVHWARLEARGDIVVSEISDPVEVPSEAAAPPEPPPEDPPTEPSADPPAPTHPDA